MTYLPPEDYTLKDQDIWYTSHGFPLQIHELDTNEWVIVEVQTWGSLEISRDVVTADDVKAYLRRNSCFN